MTGDEAPTLSVDDLYGELADADIDPLLDASLAPRSPDLLFELGGGLGASQSSVVLDVRCRDGRQLLELHTRFGCRGVGVDPVATNLARAREAVGAAPVELVLGRAESLPFAAGSFDLVWVRDVLVHVEALADALAECRRVVRRGGAVLVFQMFATEWLEPAESARLWAPLAVVPASTDRATFESAATVAGLGDC